MQFKLEYTLFGHNISLLVDSVAGTIEPDVPVWHWERLPKDPFTWQWADLMELAQRIKEYRDTHAYMAGKIGMIKACRWVACDMKLICRDGTVDVETSRPYWFGLHDAKQLVELMFANNGNSDVINTKGLYQ